MKGRILRGLSAALLCLALTDQIVQWSVLRDGYWLGRRIAPFDPPLFTSAQQERLRELERIVAGDAQLMRESIFDSDLGWGPKPNSAQGETTFDWAGSRRGFGDLARAKVEGMQRVVALGCSFTLSAEVSDTEAWVALLDQARPDLEIANLAMGGYGLDQAYLRFERDGRVLAPDEVWLGILPAAVLRVTTHFPPLLSHWNQVLAFKPRYSLDRAGQLQLHPAPARSHADTLHLLRDQQALWAAIGSSDSWMARAPLAYAASGSSLWHLSAAARLALTWHESLARAPAAHLQDPNCELFRLLVALVEAIAHSADSVGAKFKVVILPSREDLAWLKQHGQGYWQAFVAELRAHNWVTLDLSETLFAQGVLEDDSYWMPRSHYSARANALVADTIMQAGW